MGIYFRLIIEFIYIKDIVVIAYIKNSFQKT